MVETGEVVHMVVRDEDVADTQKLAWSQSIETAKIKQRAPLKHEVHVKARIVEGIVDERGNKLRGMDRSLAGALSSEATTGSREEIAS